MIGYDFTAALGALFAAGHHVHFIRIGVANAMAIFGVGGRS